MLWDQEWQFQTGDITLWTTRPQAFHSNVSWSHDYKVREIPHTQNPWRGIVFWHVSILFWRRKKKKIFNKRNYTNIFSNMHTNIFHHQQYSIKKMVKCLQILFITYVPYFTCCLLWIQHITQNICLFRGWDTIISIT